KHVADEMGPAAVQEHGHEHAAAEQRIERRGQDLRKLQRALVAGEERGHDGGTVDEALEPAAQTELVQKGQDVEPDERDVHDRDRARRDIVPERDHRALATSSGSISRQWRRAGRPRDWYFVFDITEY